MAWLLVVKGGDGGPLATPPCEQSSGCRQSEGPREGQHSIHTHRLPEAGNKRPATGVYARTAAGMRN